MKQIAVVSDVHGNLQALDAVIREAEALGVDEFAWGGDIIGYGGDPAACVKRVREIGGPCVLGNHEWMALKVAEKEAAGKPAIFECWLTNNPVHTGIAHALEDGGPELIDWMKSLPLVDRIEGAALSHAALHNLGSWPYLHDPLGAAPTLEVMESLNLSLGFFGHTHKMKIFHGPCQNPGEIPITSLPIALEADTTHAVTVGSAGQPRDGDHRAQWLLWKPAENTIEFRRTLYRVDDAAKAIRKAGLPEHSALRLKGYPL